MIAKIKMSSTERMKHPVQKKSDVTRKPLANLILNANNDKAPNDHLV